MKEGVGVSSAESSVSAAEIEEARQERDMLKEELQKQKMTAEQLRTELQVGPCQYMIRLWAVASATMLGKCHLLQKC